MAKVASDEIIFGKEKMFREEDEEEEKKVKMNKDKEVENWTGMTKVKKNIDKENLICKR